MHRSGTSAITRTLGFCGADLPDEPLAANSYNITGYWEPTQIVDLNDRILASAHSGWWDWRADPIATLDQAERDGFRFAAVTTMRRELEGRTRYLLKDPRICRMLPFWIDVLRDVGATIKVVLVLRHPAEVAASLRRRDHFDPSFSHLLWVRHNLDAERYSRDLPRAAIAFHDLFAEPATVLNRLGEFLDEDWLEADSIPLEDIRAFLQPRLTLRLAAQPDSPADSAAGRAGHAVELLWKLIDAPHDPATLSALDALRAEFETAARPFAGSFDALYSGLEKSEAVGTSLAKQLAQAHSACTESEVERAELEDRIARMRSALDNATAESRREAKLQQQEIKRLRRQIAELHQSTSWRLTQPLRVISEKMGKGKGKGKGKGAPESASAATVSGQVVAPGDGVPRQSVADKPDQEWSPADYHKKCIPFDPGKETVVVVSHDATRTGAPILALNIAQRLGKIYNVVALPLGGGPLMDDFAKSCNAVLGPLLPMPEPHLVVRAIRWLCRSIKPRYAIVNSIESRSVLPHFAEGFVPSISLVHEFAECTRPSSAVAETLHWSTATVFPAEIVKESAMRAAPGVSEQNLHVMPQGRPVLPSAPVEKKVSSAAEPTDASALLEMLRSNALPVDPVLILGAGHVHLRKGVDIFLQTAAKLRGMNPEVPFRFLWIGAGFDPERDIGYSAYLEDQIHRAGLTDTVRFVPELADFNAVYGFTDLFFLSSRLDPLPNVAIESMYQGVPVVCFERTTGIADILIDEGLGDTCVAQYLDANEAARKLCRLINDPEERDSLGSRMVEIAERRIDMARYVAELDALGTATRAVCRQEQQDIEAILQADLLRLDFYLPPGSTQTSAEVALRSLVRCETSGLPARKAMPGFHPGIYRELKQGALKGCTTADFVRSGQPNGPWLCPVLTPATPMLDTSPNLRVALHVHAFYPELFNDILTRITRGLDYPDLFVTVCSPTAAETVRRNLAAADRTAQAVRVVPNRGRDIGPLLVELGTEIATAYDVVGHVHTKKSLDLKHENPGKQWREFLLENLIGGRHRMMDRIIAAMAADAELGLVFPDDPNLVDWGANTASARALADRLGLGALPREHLRFPVGTMFWGRTAALRPIFDLGLKMHELPEEPLPYDGSILHALERLLALVAEKQGYRVAVTNVPGITR
jgi:glycosyltransferase involved in cell wall biosynthesis